jgi:hypothetical protein
VAPTLRLKALRLIVVAFGAATGGALPSSVRRASMTVPVARRGRLAPLKLLFFPWRATSGPGVVNHQGKVMD